LWRKVLKSRRKHCYALCLTVYDKVMHRGETEPDQWVACITMSDPFDCLPAAVAQDKAVGQAPLGGALILIHV